MPWFIFQLRSQRERTADTGLIAAAKQTIEKAERAKQRFDTNKRKGEELAASTERLFVQIRRSAPSSGKGPAPQPPEKH